MERITAKWNGIGISRKGEPEARFVLSSEGAINRLNELKYKEYEVSITELKDRRTKAQNRLLWELIGEIDIELNGSRSADEEIYMQILDMAGAKVEYIAVRKDMAEGIRKALENSFRFVKEVDDWKKNDAEMVTLKCYYGSSKMDKDEMARVIDTTMTYAEECGIVTDYWKGLLNDTRREGAELVQRP